MTFDWLKTLLNIGGKAVPLIGGITEAVTHPSADTIGALAPTVISVVEEAVKTVQSLHEQSIAESPVAAPPLPVNGDVVVSVVNSVPQIPASLMFSNEMKKRMAVGIATFGIQSLFALRGHSTPKIILDGLPDQVERSLATMKYISAAIGAAVQEFQAPQG